MFLKSMKLKNRDILEWVLFFFIIIPFMLFSLFCIRNIKYGTAPDEFYHIYVSEAYSKTFFIPKNTSSTYTYGDVTRIPYLSFWINARLINLNSRFTNFGFVPVLRLFNLFISLGTLLITFLLSKLVINKNFFNLLPVFLLSNTLMFAFLSSAINYDNLTNLLCVFSVYFLVKFLKFKKNKYILWYLIILNLGVLTKFTVLPLIFIEVILTIFFLFRNKKINFGFLKSFLRNKILLLFFGLTSVLVFLLYGVNLIKYGSLLVSCDKVLTVQQCMRNGVYNRSSSLNNFVIKTFKDFSLIEEKRKTSPASYFFNWRMSMVERIYGIWAHQSMPREGYYSNWYLILFFISFLIVIRKWERTEKIDTVLILLFVFYFLVLLVFQNYRTYIKTNTVIALQGRYIFPVLSVFYIVIVKYWEKIKNIFIKLFIIFLSIIIFYYGCFPFFFNSLTSDWLIF